VYWLVVAALVIINLACLPYFIFLLAIALAAILARRQEISEDDPSSKFLIVIPAHNEESGIAITVRSCLSADYPSLFFGVLVVADNCTDQTAARAREAGARVVERSNMEKKSKGYALEYILDSLQQSGELAALDAVVVVDADTTIDPNLMRAFDEELRKGRQWLQAYYTVANPDASWRTRLLVYAFSLFNGVLQFGLNALGSSAGFRGNGMCFATRGLTHRPWRSYGLVEDMEYSWKLRVSGEKIRFVREARVYGIMVASGGQAAADQRLRWEFGRREMRTKYLGPLLQSPEIGWGEKITSACELSIPSMGWLALVYVFVVGIDAAAWFALSDPDFDTARGFLLACGVTMTLALALYAISPFLVMRLPLRYIWTIVCFPFYMLWKLAISLRGRPPNWVRTARQPDGHL
jgi:cellulose synthase/poly-beta-1,6-N-acetylglucosamine synthase-like glycosyltransferase